MAVSYKKLFKILIDRDMKKKEFRDFVGISYSTMSKLEKARIQQLRSWKRYVSSSVAGSTTSWKLYLTVLIMGQGKV